MLKYSNITKTIILYRKTHIMAYPVVQSNTHVLILIADL